MSQNSVTFSNAVHVVTRHTFKEKDIKINSEGKEIVNLSGGIWFTNIEHGKVHKSLSLMTMEDNIKCPFSLFWLWWNGFGF